MDRILRMDRLERMVWSEWHLRMERTIGTERNKRVVGLVWLDRIFWMDPFQ